MNSEQTAEIAADQPCTCKRRGENRAPDHRGCQRHWLLALLDEVNDLRSRLACVSEASYWDRPYDERLAAIRGMCDLATDGMTAHLVGDDLANLIDKHKPITNGAGHPVGCQCRDEIGFSAGQTWADHLAERVYSPGAPS